jgi:hypothetical protein
MSEETNGPGSEKAYIRVIRTVEFGLALGALWAAWSAGGDMFLVVPALIVGLIFAIIGIGTIPASKRYKLSAVAVVALIYLGIGFFLNWHFQPKPEAVTAKPNPPKASVPPSPHIMATAGRIEYRCKWDGLPLDQKALDKKTAAFRDYMTNYADYIGVAVSFPKIQGGDRAEMTPKPTIGGGDDHFGNYSKVIIEIRRLGKDLLGVFIAEFKSNPLNVVSNQPVQQGSELEVRIRKRIEDLAGVQKGECELQ